MNDLTSNLPPEWIDKVEEVQYSISRIKQRGIYIMTMVTVMAMVMVMAMDRVIMKMTGNQHSGSALKSY